MCLLYQCSCRYDKIFLFLFIWSQWLSWIHKITEMVIFARPVSNHMSFVSSIKGTHVPGRLITCNRFIRLPAWWEILHWSYGYNWDIFMDHHCPTRQYTTGNYWGMLWPPAQRLEPWARATLALIWWIHTENNIDNTAAEYLQSPSLNSRWMLYHE